MVGFLLEQHEQAERDGVTVFAATAVNQVQSFQRAENVRLRDVADACSVR